MLAIEIYNLKLLFKIITANLFHPQYMQTAVSQVLALPFFFHTYYISYEFYTYLFFQGEI